MTTDCQPTTIIDYDDDTNEVVVLINYANGQTVSMRKAAPYTPPMINGRVLRPHDGVSLDMVFVEKEAE